MQSETFYKLVLDYEHFHIIINLITKNNQISKSIKFTHFHSAELTGSGLIPGTSVLCSPPSFSDWATEFSYSGLQNLDRICAFGLTYDSSSIKFSRSTFLHF